MSLNKPIEAMSLEELQANVTEMSDEDLLAYLNGTRNNRLKPGPKPKKKSSKKKKEKTETVDALVALLAEMGPGAMEALAKMMEEGNE